jgi:hypothetical protein
VGPHGLNILRLELFFGEPDVRRATFSITYSETLTKTGSPQKVQHSCSVDPIRVRRVPVLIVAVECPCLLSARSCNVHYTRWCYQGPEIKFRDRRM